MKRNCKSDTKVDQEFDCQTMQWQILTLKIHDVTKYCLEIFISHRLLDFNLFLKYIHLNYGVAFFLV